MVENFKWYFLGSYPNISDVGCGGRQSVFVFVILEYDAGAAGKHREESTRDDDDDHDDGEDDPDEWHFL